MHKILGVTEYHLANLETSITALTNNACKQKAMANLEKIKLGHENGKFYLAAKGWYLQTCNLTEYRYRIQQLQVVLCSNNNERILHGMALSYLHF